MHLTLSVWKWNKKSSAKYDIRQIILYLLDLLSKVEKTFARHVYEINGDAVDEVEILMRLLWRKAHYKTHVQLAYFETQLLSKLTPIVTLSVSLPVHFALVFRPTL